MPVKQPPQLACADAEPVGQAFDIGLIERRRPRSARARGIPYCAVPRQNARSGEVSGRQRRQGRKPASWAAAADE